MLFGNAFRNASRVAEEAQHEEPEADVVGLHGVDHPAAVLRVEMPELLEEHLRVRPCKCRDERLQLVRERGDHPVLPESHLDGVRIVADRPRLELEELLAPRSMEHHPQVPVAKAVAHEEQVALLELGRDRRREDVPDVRVRQIVDEIRLGDDVAVVVEPLDAPDGAVDLRDHRHAVGEEIGAPVLLADQLRLVEAAVGARLPP